MEKEVLVKVDGVSKKFSKDLKRSLRYGLADIVRGVFKTEMKTTLRKDEFWAVKDVSFEVRRGECLGLIGHNGAGKSTLLKMLNGLISPDEGKIEMIGRVGALIELGAGFNPVLTGRENIYNNGAVLGFSRAEIDEKMAEIIAFSEIEDYLDMPVQNYSSGMKVRLGFAVAAQMEPDILLIDEVLAVGDMRFVLKCINKIDQLLPNTAIIFVSHAMPLVARMTSQIVLMNKGKVHLSSDKVNECIKEYYLLNDSGVVDFQNDGDISLASVQLFSDKNGWCSNKSPFEISNEVGFVLRMNFHIKRSIQNINIYMVFYDAEQRGFAEVMNFPVTEEGRHEYSKDFSYDAKFERLPLSQGKYSITVALSSEDDGKRITHFRTQNCAQIVVNSDFNGWTPINFEPKWIEVTL